MIHVRAFLNSANTQRLVIGLLCGWVFGSRFWLGNGGLQGKGASETGQEDSFQKSKSLLAWPEVKDVCSYLRYFHGLIKGSLE